MKHTPTPWSIIDSDGPYSTIRSPEDVRICASSTENAAFIVRAVNSHDELLEAAKRLLEFINTDFRVHTYEGSSMEAIVNLTRAIAKAEGK